MLATIYSLLVGVSGLAVLGYLLVTQSTGLDWVAILVFAALSSLAQRSSFHLGSTVEHSLAGVIDLAAIMALGPLNGAAVAAVSGLFYLVLNALRRGKLTSRNLVRVPTFNAGLKVWMALAAGALLLALLGPAPSGFDLILLRTEHPPILIFLAVLAVSLLWFTLDHVGWALLDFLEGGKGRLRLFLSEMISRTLLVELLPLPFSIVVALVYLRLDWIAFALLALAIVAVSILAGRWAKARNDLEQRVAELSTVERVGQAIARAELNVDEICKLMYEHTSQIADTTIFHLGLFDDESFTLKLWVREGHVQPQQTFQLEPGVGLVNWLRISKQSILVRDFEKEQDSLPARPAYVSDRPPLSALFVPLMAGDSVIGTVSIQSYRRSAYGESDLRVLSAMANQAAVAIQKARLYSQERKRVRQLETIEQVSRQVSAILDLEQLFHRVVSLIRENFGYYHVAIYTTDEKRQEAAFRASSSAGEQDVAPDVEWGQGLVGWVAAHGQSLTVNDVENDTRYRCVEALEETRSELVVPFTLEGEAVGALDVQSDQPNAFGSDDLFILETLGSQVAIAIQDARLYEAERQQAWFSTVLLQVAEAASRLSDMDDLLATIARLVPLLAGVDRCAILLWEPETETFVPSQAHGLAPELRQRFKDTVFSPQTVPALEMLRWDPAPLLISGIHDTALLPLDLVETFNIHEMLLLPLLAQGDLLGVMMVDYAGRPHPFGKRIIEMLGAIANQSATVIHSAQLVQGQQEEAYISMALLQVADTVSRSADLTETMAAITRITPMLVGVNACAILMWDAVAESLIPFQQYGLDKDLEPGFWRIRLNKGDPVVRGLLEDREPVQLGDLRGEAVPAAQLSLMLDLLPEGAVLMAFPLTSRGAVQGAMLVDYRGPASHSSGRWMSILTGIAGQAAIAIENDHLSQESAEQERMQQELAVARRIQASFLPEQCPTAPGWELAAVWRSARQVGGDFYDFMPLSPGAGAAEDAGIRTGVVIADVADKGVPAALFMALSRTLVRTVAITGRPPDLTIARANDLIVSDARSDLFVTLFYAILELQDGEITYVNAGHMPPLLVRAAGGATEELRTRGMALGVLPGIEFEQRTAHLEPDDTLVLYTDGVIEAMNAEQQMFGKERLLEVVMAHRNRPATELAQAIDETIEAFVGDAAQFDDFTLVIAKRK